MPQRYLVTAGLPYSNGRLHVGHIAGAYLPADIFARYCRARGRELLFICGSDDNGVAIEISAMQEGRSPQEISTHFHQRQRADFAGLGVSFDIYGGTHQPDFVELHQRFSQEFFLRIHERGYFTKRRTRQLFDPAAQRFLPDRYVRGTCYHPGCGAAGATGDQCDACGRLIEPLLLIDPVSVITGGKTEVRETTHWHLRLSDFEKPLTEWLERQQGHWRPGTLNFALGQLRQGLPERSMTRDVAWGIPVPLDDPDARGKVLFVWFDAPIGYISFTAACCAARGGDWRDYQHWWSDPACDIINFIGEDNTVFHTLTWPAMLMADQRHRLAANVVVNNFMNCRIRGEERKISKSSTPPESPVWIEAFLQRFDPDALRYYLTVVAPESARTFFDPADFITRNNAELVAAFGNFFNRGLTFAARYFDNRVPDASAATDADRAHIAAAARTLTTVGDLIDAHRYKSALDEVMGLARACNQHFDARQPWSSRKSDPADCAASVACFLHAMHFLAVVAAPFMPGAALRAVRMLGLWGDHPPTLPLTQTHPALTWTPPPPPPPGRALGEARILFPKLEPSALDDGAPQT